MVPPFSSQNLTHVARTLTVPYWDLVSGISSYPILSAPGNRVPSSVTEQPKVIDKKYRCSTPTSLMTDYRQGELFFFLESPSLDIVIRRKCAITCHLNLTYHSRMVRIKGRRQTRRILIPSSLKAKDLQHLNNAVLSSRFIRTLLLECRFCRRQSHPGRVCDRCKTRRIQHYVYPYHFARTEQRYPRSNQ